MITLMMDLLILKLYIRIIIDKLKMLRLSDDKIKHIDKEQLRPR